MASVRRPYNRTCKPGIGGAWAAPYLCGMTTARFIGSDIYRDSTYGRGHPLAIPRVSLAIDLIDALGWFPDGSYLDSPMADEAYLARFHTPDYVDAVIRAEQEQDAAPEIRARHNIGAGGNPIFPEMFRRPATAAGGGGLAAATVAGGGVAYNLGGGQHHGRPDRASGFCYFNEPVLTIGMLLEQGLERVFYLDLDAHHGDGVQDAFADDDRVFTLSIHELGRWPMKRGETDPRTPGGVLDRAGGAARNLPVPPGFTDDELTLLIDAVALPLIQAFRPDALFVQGGVDAMADDPQSGQMLSNRALWRAVAAVKDMAPRLILSGGGGYNPFGVARAWAGMWGTLAGFEVPQRLPEAARAVLAAVTWRHRLGRDMPARWLETLADPPSPAGIRDTVRALVRETAHP